MMYVVLCRDLLLYAMLSAARACRYEAGLTDDDS